MKYLWSLIALAFSSVFNSLRSMCGLMPLEAGAQDRTEFVFENNFPHLSENGGGASGDHLGKPAAAS